MKSITPVISQNLIDLNKEKYAKEFSEGNSSLEKCLLLLWDKGYKTIGCCGGHNNKGAYIGFELDKKTAKFLSNMKKDNIKITFSSLINEKTNQLHFTIKEINNDKIFENIIKSHNKDKPIDNNIVTAINFILKKYLGYINIRIWYGKTITTYIVTDNLKLIDYFSKHNEKTLILDENKHLYSFKINLSYLSDYLNKRKEDDK